jgi:hypothetical protein
MPEQLQIKHKKSLEICCKNIPLNVNTTPAGGGRKPGSGVGKRIISYPYYITFLYPFCPFKNYTVLLWWRN